MAYPHVYQWNDPPKVSRGEEEDFGPMISEKYEGENLAGAQRIFLENDLNWDTMSPAGFKEVIRQLAGDREYSDTVGPACFVFCYTKIPEGDRRGWILAVMAANDKHQDD